MGMREKEIRTIYIHPNLENTINNPSNSIIVYEIELIEINPNINNYKKLCSYQPKSYFR